MSHEVNNSIGAANSLLHSCLPYAAQLPDEDCTDLSTALTVSIERTEHLNGFMHNFANVFRLPAPVRETCEVRALLTSVVLLCKAECEQQRIAVEWRERESPVGQADRRQLEQVFINVFKNALEAIGANGTITLCLARDRLVIEDSGGGLSAEARAHLFTPFFSTKPQGQGLGLTLVQEILDAHGFTFALESLPGSYAIYDLVRRLGKKSRRRKNHYADFFAACFFCLALTRLQHRADAPRHEFLMA